MINIAYKLAAIILFLNLAPSVANARIVNQLSPDIMLLRAEVIATISTKKSSGVQLKNCDNKSRPNYASWYDCTQALEKKYSAPALNMVYLKQDSNIECKVQRVKVFVKKIAMGSSKGIGFAHGRQERGYNVKFLDRHALKVIDQRTITNNIPGFVYQFIGISSCKLGSVEVDYKFRPFLAFKTQSGSNYRSWDRFGFYQIPTGESGFDQTSQITEFANGASSVGNTTTSGQTEVFENGQPVGEASGEGLKFEENEESYILPD